MTENNLLYYVFQRLANDEYLGELYVERDFNEKDKKGHYLQMIDYQDLATIINNEPSYKKSPTIQSIFNYKSYRLEDEGEIIFNYKNIKCDHLIQKEQKNYNVKLLFLYLLECNIEDRMKEIIQLGGDNTYDLEEMFNYDMYKKGDEPKEEGLNNDNDNNDDEERMKKEIENVREIERERIMERRRIEEEFRNQAEQEEKQKDIDQQENFEKEIEQQKDKTLVNEKIDGEEGLPIQTKVGQEKELLNDIEDYQNNLSKQEEEISKKVETEIENEMLQNKLFEDKMNEEERKVKEHAMKERMEMEKRIEIKIKGYEQYLENRTISNISKNSFAIYNVNWFNVCCGIEKYDNTFEEDIQQKIRDMGLIINEEEIVKE